jgi:hypothetical protein
VPTLLRADRVITRCRLLMITYSILVCDIVSSTLYYGMIANYVGEFSPKSIRYPQTQGSTNYLNEISAVVQKTKGAPACHQISDSHCLFRDVVT